MESQVIRPLQMIDCHMENKARERVWDDSMDLLVVHEFMTIGDNLMYYACFQAKHVFIFMLH